MIPIGSYQPDLADTNPGVARVATNVLLTKDANGLAHGPHPSLGVVSSATALPAAPRGGVSAVSSTGSYSAFVGTASNIYKMSADYELDATTSVGSGYAVPTGDNWSFAKFGNLLHATNTVDGLEQFAVDAGSAFSAVSGAPKGRHIFTAFNSLFMLACDGDARLMRNSAIGNSTIWDSKGAGYQAFDAGEQLMCGAELSEDIAIVLQRNAINILERRYDGKLFNKKVIATERGAASPWAFASADGMAFWLDTDGFWLYRVGQGLMPVGFNRVNKTFIAALVDSGADGVTISVDRANNRFVARYQAQTGGTATVFENAISYNYLLDEWGEMEITTSAILSMASPGYTMDNIDGFGTLDALPYSLDSRFWAGGEPRLAALDGDFKFGFFDADNLAATSETATYANARSQLVRSVTPDTDADNLQVTLGVRDKASEDITWKTAVSMKTSGRCPVLGRGKLITLRSTVAAGEIWGYMRGYDHIEAAEGGPR